MEHHQSDLLKKINRVPVPEHLLAEINSRIQATDSRQIPLRWAVAASVALGLWCAANAWLITQKYQSASASSNLTALVQGLQLNHSNQLYDE